ncbi:MAG: MBL fold metallo-hydrolase [Firmicutes bacterium]|nr:MBL fold metallo-hydrolase [Bacillota bacterium]
MQLSPKVWRLASTKDSAAYMILTADGYTLIDTGLFTAARAIIKELNHMQVTSLSKILLTHHDQDHIGNMSLLQRKYNCPIYINSLDMPYIYGQKRRHSTKALFDFFIKTDNSATLSALEDAAFNDITVVHTPGHTPGHSCFLFEDFLFAGDLFRLPKLRLKPYWLRTGWNTPKLENTIRKAIGLPFNWVCPAHFLPVKISP